MNGVATPSPLAIVVDEQVYVAITPMVAAMGGESEWLAAEQTIAIRTDLGEVVSESVSTNLVLGPPRVGVQASGQTRVVLEVPAGASYELYASETTFVIKLPGLTAQPFSKDFDDPNLQRVRYALVDGSLALVITSRHRLDAGKGYYIARLPATEKDAPERFYVDLAPTLEGDPVASASSLTVADLTPAHTHAAAEKVIVLDAGHGGEDPGTLTSYAVEKEGTLAVTLKLKALLESQGIKVILTRDTDTYPTLEERSQRATPDTNLFVSIHVNSAEDSSARGVETWVFGEPLEPSLIALAIEENGGGATGAARTQDALETAQSVTGDIFRETQLSYSETLAETVQQELIRITASED
jgi:N-acetylmuramoyl-L-alanine amidase